MNNYKELKIEWYKKLKDSGFKDIENDYNDRMSNNPMKFENVKGDFFANRKEYNDFFRIIGLYAHHVTTMDEEKRKVLKEYAMCGFIPKALKNTKSKLTKVSLWVWVKRNFPKMLKFVNEMDRQDD